MDVNNNDELIELYKFAKLKGINADKVVEMIRDGFYVGRKVGDEWFVSKSELQSDEVKNKEYETSLTRKITLIEISAVFIYIVVVFTIQYGIFYLLLSPLIPLIFAIIFLLTGIKYKGESYSWKGMFALNLGGFVFLTFLFWVVAFRDFH